MLELIRCVAAALNDGGIGVNVQIANVPLDAGDPMPAQINEVLDITTDPETALEQVPLDGYPLLMVGSAEPVEWDGEVVSGIRNGKGKLRMYYANANTDTAAATRDAFYTVRALELCLNQFHANENWPMRIRNNIMIQECLGLVQEDIGVTIKDAKVVTSMLATYLIRNIQP
jgi:hypothetical protein